MIGSNAFGWSYLGEGYAGITSVPVTLTVPAATATVQGVAPGLRARFVVPAATASTAAVAPHLAASFGVPASTASVATTAAFRVSYAVTTMTQDDTAFPPTLRVSFTAPAMSVAAEMVAPAYTQTGDILNPPRLRGVGNGVIQVWQLEEETRPSYVYLTPTMQATATLNRPQLVISELPMDEDLSLLLELALV